MLCHFLCVLALRQTADPPPARPHEISSTGTKGPHRHTKDCGQRQWLQKRPVKINSQLIWTQNPPPQIRSHINLNLPIWQRGGQKNTAELKKQEASRDWGVFTGRKGGIPHGTVHCAAARGSMQARWPWSQLIAVENCGGRISAWAAGLLSGWDMMMERECVASMCVLKRWAMKGWTDCRGKVCVVTLSILFIQVRSQVMSKFYTHARTHTLQHAVEKCACVCDLSEISYWMDVGLARLY